MTAQLVAQHVALLAERTAASLAKGAKTDVELRDALSTSKLDANTVRIGKYDIHRDEDEDGNPVFSISRAKTDNVILKNIAFYETCRFIVAYLNDGGCVSGFNVRGYLRDNDQYNRLRTDVSIYKSQIEVLTERGDTMRLQLIEDRLSDAMARALLLQHQLLTKRR